MSFESNKQNDEHRTHLKGNDSKSGYRNDGVETFAEHYNKMNTYNGLYTGKYADKNKVRKKEKLNLYDTIASHLQLTPYQKRRGKYITEKLDFSGFGELLEMGVYCVILAVTSEDGREHSPGDREPTDDVFAEFEASQSFDENRLWKAHLRFAEEIISRGL